MDKIGLIFGPGNPDILNVVKDVAKISTNKLSTFGFDFTFMVV